MSRARVTRRLTALTAATALLSAAGLASGVLVGVANAQTATSVAPNAATNQAAGVTTLTITGSGFTAALDTVTLIPRTTGDEVYTDQTKPGKITTSVNTQTSTATSLVFTADLRQAAPVQYNVVVSQSSVPSATVATCNACLTVFSPGRPTVTGVSADGGAGSIVVNGTNFARGAKLTWLTSNGLNPPTYTVDPALTFVAGHDKTTNGTTTHTTGYPSSTQIKGVYTPGGGFVAGRHFLKVTNLDNQGSTQIVEFWQPKFTAVAPTSIGQGATNFPVTVTGTGIRDGSRFSISNFSSTKADVTVGTSTASNNTTIVAPVSVAGPNDTNAGGLSLRTTYILGPDGGYTTGSGPTVTAPPVVDSIDVSDLGAGALDEPATITGSGFVSGATFAISGGGITVTTVSVTATTANVKISIANDALVGGRDALTATNPDGGTGTLAVDNTVPVLPVYPFTVDTGPVITGISPANFTPGANTSVTVSGTGFATSGGASLTATGGKITFTGTTVVNATTVTATAVVPADTPVGAQSVTIKNTTNKGRYTCVACIGVDGLSVNPVTGPNSNNDFDITFTATGTSSFTGATGTLLRKTGGATAAQPVIPGTAKTSGSGTLTQGFDLSNAAPGKYDGVVTVPAGEISCTACFTVTGQVFTVTSPSTATPAKGGQGAVDFPLTLTGTNFSHGMKVTIPGLTVSDSTFVSPTSVTVKVTVPAATATGLKNVLVTNADGGNPITITNGYSVTAAPTITTPKSDAPATLGQGANNFDVAITGTGFTASSVTISGADVTGTVTKTDATHLVAHLTAAGTAALGARDITITSTDDGGSATSVGALVITAKPVVTLVSPAKLAKGKSATFTISGQGFQSTSVVTIASVTFSGTRTVAADGSTITVDGTVASAAALGARNVNVDNADGGHGVCSGCFTVEAPKAPPAFTFGTNTIAAGQKTKVLITGVAGDVVQVNVKGAGASSYSVLASLTLNANGAGSVIISPSTNSSYIVSNSAGASPAKTLTVKAVQSLVVQVSGHTGIFTGHVAPSVVGRTVTVYFYKAGSHVAVACSTKTTPGGQFKCQHTFTPGTYNTFGQTNADKYNAAARSGLHTNTF